MPPLDKRKELIERVVQTALQEWRSRPEAEEQSGVEAAHVISHALFEDLPPGSFSVKKIDTDKKS